MSFFAPPSAPRQTPAPALPPAPPPAPLPTPDLSPRMPDGNAKRRRRGRAASIVTSALGDPTAVITSRPVLSAASGGPSPVTRLGQ